VASSALSRLIWAVSASATTREYAAAANRDLPATLPDEAPHDLAD
jgi:hypothetical protein